MQVIKIVSVWSWKSDRKYWLKRSLIENRLKKVTLIVPWQTKLAQLSQPSSPKFYSQKSRFINVISSLHLIYYYGSGPRRIFCNLKNAVIQSFRWLDERWIDFFFDLLLKRTRKVVFTFLFNNLLTRHFNKIS